MDQLLQLLLTHPMSRLHLNDLPPQRLEMTHFLHMSIDKPTDVEMTDCYLTEIWKFNARYVMQMGNYCYYHYQGTMATTTIATITTTCQGCHERSGSSGVPVKST